VELSPLYCGHFWPIVPAPDDSRGWLWSYWWNEDWQEKPKYSERTCPSAALSTTNPTWPDPGSNPGHRCFLIIEVQLLPWEHVCLRNHYSVTVIYLLISQSLVARAGLRVTLCSMCDSRNMYCLFNWNLLLNVRARTRTTLCTISNYSWYFTLFILFISLAFTLCLINHFLNNFPTLSNRENCLPCFQYVGQFKNENLLFT
jgi:hypothetical protein